MNTIFKYNENELTDSQLKLMNEQKNVLEKLKELELDIYLLSYETDTEKALSMPIPLILEEHHFPFSLYDKKNDNIKVINQWNELLEIADKKNLYLPTDKYKNLEELRNRVDGKANFPHTINVNIKYNNPIEVWENIDWKIATHTIPFKDLESAIKYVYKIGTVSGWLTDTIPIREDEIPLSITYSNSDDILWENKTFINKLIDNIKNNRIPIDKVIENIVALKNTSFISDFSFNVKGRNICADMLVERIYPNNVHYYEYEIAQYEGIEFCEDKDIYLGFYFFSSDVTEVFYKNERIIDYSIKDSQKMQEYIIKINKEPTKNIYTNMLQVIGEYEQLNAIPNDKRITTWFEDYDIYEAKRNIQKNDIIKNYIELEKKIRNSIDLPCYDYKYDYYDLMCTPFTKEHFINSVIFNPSDSSNPIDTTSTREKMDIFNYIDEHNLKEFSMEDFYIPLQKNIPVVCLKINKIDRFVEVPNHYAHSILQNRHLKDKEELKTNKTSSFNKQCENSR